MNSTIYLSTVATVIAPEATEVIAVKKSFNDMLHNIDHDALYGECDNTVRVLDVMTRAELMEQVYPLTMSCLIAEIAKINRALAM